MCVPARNEYISDGDWNLHSSVEMYMVQSHENAS